MAEVLRVRGSPKSLPEAERAARRAAPVDVEEFCRQTGLVAELETVRSLAQEFFNPSAMTSELVLDPDTGETMIVVNVTLSGASAGEALEMYRRYTEHFTQTIPWPQRMKFGLSYDIV